MIQGTEIGTGVWALQNSETGRNVGVILWETGEVVIDPSFDGVDLDALEQFLGEMGRKVGAFIFTYGREQSEVAISHSQPGRPLGHHVPQAWEALPLAEDGRLGVYNKAEGILFCGDMLPGAGIPMLKGGVEGYLEALEKIEALDARLVATMRGAVAQGKREVRARIEQDRSYVYSLVRHVATSYASGLRFERVWQVASEVYADSPYLEKHLDNIRYVWGDLTKKG